MLVYSEKELELYKYANKEMDRTWNKRDFVPYVQKYFASDNDKILAIGGLRGTGKTIGLLQASENFDACYITAQENEVETADDYISLLRTIKNKCIIIDEYSWIKDREKLDKYLYTAVQNGKRIAITGTESITLDFLNYGSLIHRVDMIHTTMFTYEEYLRLYNKKHSKETCKDYLINGGLFEEYAIKNFESMRNYIDTAIVKNLSAYMGDRMSEEKARTLTYAVLYKAICPDNLNTIPVLTKNNLSMENFLVEMGINSQLEFTAKDLKNVADIFEQIGLIIRVPNIDSQNLIKEQYYITNPSLSCQLILAAYDIQELNNDILGYMFESSAMIHVATHKLDEHKLFFANTEVEKGQGKELDIIVTDRKKDFAYLIECKLRAKDKISTSSTLRSGAIEDKFFEEADIIGRYVVYNGEPSIRNYDDNDVLFVPIGNMLTKYYEFESNKSKILGMNPGQPSGGPEGGPEITE